MQRGFIQIPILIALLITALVGGGAYVAYEARSQSVPASQEFNVAETRTNTTASTSVIIEDEQADEGKHSSQVSEDKNEVVSGLKETITKLTEQITQSSSKSSAIVATTSLITLGSGAIVEIDEMGNIIRTIKEAPQQPTFPATSNQSGATTSTPPSPKLEIKETPKYVMEYEKYTSPADKNFDALLSWRIKSASSNSPSILKIVARILVEGEPFAALDSHLRSSYAGLDSTYVTNLGTATDAGRPVIILDYSTYNPIIPSYNVSPNFSLKLNLVDPGHGARLVVSNPKMSIKFIQIHLVSGEVYEIVVR